MGYLPAGCATPDVKELDAFWERAGQATEGSYHARWIGLDHDSTEQVLELIIAGDKTGTFTLPWIVAHTDHPDPAVGDFVMLIDFSGSPRILVELTAIETVLFGAVTADHIKVDGTPVRDLAIWKALHTSYWNGMLQPFELAISDDMPVLIEKFRLVYYTT
jgi:uncharacterized protein YhfF